MKPPNILYVHSHDTGRLIAPYGAPVPTPHLAALAREGAVFRQCHCAAPTCSPSRAALLTGQGPHAAGMLGLAHLGWRLADYRRHLVHVLRPAGYRSALAGIQHIAPEPSPIGYDEVVDVGRSHRAAEVAPPAAAWLAAGPSEPFFLSVGIGDTHRPFPDPPAGSADAIRPPAVLPDAPETRRDMAGFAESARRLDAGVGQVLGALAAAGLAERTVVVMTTDHGPAFPGMKCNLTDGGTGVLLILRGPRISTGVHDALVSHVDVLPTLAELAGVDVPAWAEGASLLPLIGGRAERIREEVFTEVTYHAAYEPQRAVRTDRWKYIRRFGDRRRRVACNCDAGPTKALLMAHGWAEQDLPEEALYDLIFDPNEACNLAADPARADVLADLRARLHAWMRRTNDPLLTGRPAPPPGATLCPADALDPKEKRPASEVFDD